MTRTKNGWKVWAAGLGRTLWVTSLNGKMSSGTLYAVYAGDANGPSGMAVATVSGYARMRAAVKAAVAGSGWLADKVRGASA